MKNRCILFDWGDTLMRNFPEYLGPMAAWPRVEAVPAAAEVLAELHPGWLLALATNAADSNEADILAAFKRVGLDQLLDRVYCYRKVKARKPDPAFFAFILEDLQLPPERLVMVGDDFDNDVLGANRAGLQAVWFNPFSEQERSGPLYRTIHDLRELPSVLERSVGE